MYKQVECTASSASPSETEATYYTELQGERPSLAECQALG